MLIGKLSEVAEFEGRFIYERLSKGKSRLKMVILEVGLLYKYAKSNN